MLFLPHLSQGAINQGPAQVELLETVILSAVSPPCSVLSQSCQFDLQNTTGLCWAPPATFSEGSRASKQSPAFLSCAETRVMVKNRSHQTFDGFQPVVLRLCLSCDSAPCSPRATMQARSASLGLYFHLFSPGLSSNIVSEGPLTIPAC